jgi:hypothetical protein
LAKVRTTWGKASDRLRQRVNKRNKTVSDVFRHRSGKESSYCRKRFDVGSERVKGNRIFTKTWIHAYYVILVTDQLDTQFLI